MDTCWKFPDKCQILVISLGIFWHMLETSGHTQETLSDLDFLCHMIENKYNVFVRSKFSDTCWTHSINFYQSGNLETHAFNFQTHTKKLLAILTFLSHRIKNCTIYLYNPNFQTLAGYFQTPTEMFSHLIDKWYHLHVQWRISRPKPEISRHRPVFMRNQLGNPLLLMVSNFFPLR